MAEPFLSEIRIMSFAFAPKGWALCNGQQLPINQNQALFSLLGTTYGGNGQTTFALPDLRGRTPLHMGTGYPLGQQGGEAAHTVSLPELPSHTHSLNGAPTAATTNVPTGNVLARGQAGNNPLNYYDTSQTNLVAMNQASIGSIGGSQPHENMQPYLTLTFAIALQGIFPSQN
jgi:microcystin-dependent protein